MVDPYERLANAIIIQATKDWREAMIRLKKKSYNYDARNVRDETERFFRSQWFSVLTNLDGEALLRKLREELTI